MNNLKEISGKPDAAFVICVEQGLLEYKALCLIVSLRKNFGAWADLPIYAYSPRKGREVSPWMLDIYSYYNVTSVIEPINTDYVDYPLANKPLCMAHAERTLTCKYIIFLDSDILCWREPTLFSLKDDVNLAMTVDTTKTVASSGGDDPNDIVWMSLYEVFGSNKNHFITTSLDEKRVKSWWGSGVIAVRRDACLMEEWYKGFRYSVENIRFLDHMFYLREQMTISALTAAHLNNFEELPIAYNYQVQNFGHYSAKGVPPQNAVLWHYQPYFNRVFNAFAEKIDKRKTLSDKVGLAELFIDELWSNYQTMIGFDEGWKEVLRKKIKVRNKVELIKSLLGISLK